jgi:hypothetical protein
MKVIATVKATEFLERSYTIDCGDGKQFVHWIATTACLQFGQEHYPPGIYIPTLLYKLVKDKEGDYKVFPHPRSRINNKQSDLADGDHVYIHLKDRSKQPSDDEADWYEKAFGKKRNMQQFSLNYVPLFDKKNQFDFFVKLTYKIFPELLDERENAKLYE